MVFNAESMHVHVYVTAGMSLPLRDAVIVFPAVSAVVSMRP